MAEIDYGNAVDKVQNIEVISFGLATNPDQFLLFTGIDDSARIVYNSTLALLFSIEASIHFSTTGVAAYLVSRSDLNMQLKAVCCGLGVLLGGAWSAQSNPAPSALQMGIALPLNITSEIYQKQPNNPVTEMMNIGPNRINGC